MRRQTIFDLLEAFKGGSVDPLADYDPPHLSEPTEAKAGSDEKILELRKRLERGEQLWSDLDNLEKDDQKIEGVPIALTGLDAALIGRSTSCTRSDYYKHRKPDWKKKSKGKTHEQ